MKRNSEKAERKENPLKDIIEKSKEKILLNYKKGDYLFQENEKARGIYFVISGHVKIIKSGSKPENIVLHIASPGDVLGIHSVIDEQVYTNSAVALTKAAVCFIPSEEFLLIINRNIGHKLLVMNLLCFGIDLLENKITVRGEKSTTARLAENLIFFVNTCGLTHKQTLKIELSLEDLSGLVGTTKTYLNKVIKKFIRQGLISFERKKITINNMQKLKILANGPA